MRSARRVAVWHMLWMLGGGACAAGEAPERDALYASRDSAGIAIRDYRMPDSTDVERWEVSEPVVIIGAEDQAPDNLLDRVVGVTRMSDGRIVAALESEELRVFDSTGRFLRRIGRKGQGPGEFTTLDRIGRIRGDTLVAYNRYPERLVVFAPDGEFVRSSHLVAPGSGPANAEFPAFAFHGLFPDGTVLVERHPGERRTPPGGVKVDSTNPLRIDLKGRVLADYGRRWQSDEVRVPASGGTPLPRDVGRTLTLPFDRRRASWGRAGNQVFYTTSDRFEIELWSADGRLTRIIRVPTRVIRKTAADSMRGTFRDQTFDFAAATPDSLPPISFVAGDDAGNLWVTVHPRALPWTPGILVFDSSGVLRASVLRRRDTGAGARLRSVANLLEIGEHHMTGVAIDSLDVPLIVVRRVRKPH